MRLVLEAVPLVLFFAIGIAVFCSSIYGMDWVFDDHFSIKENRALKPSTPIGTLLTDDFWGTPMYYNISHKSYRPLTVATFRFNAWLANGVDETSGFHMTNAVLHGLATAAVFCCTVGLLPEPRARTIAALVFALHPVHTEAVANATGRSDILCSLLCLLAVSCYAKTAQGAWLPFVSAVILTAAAVLSKETGIMAVPLMAAHDLLPLVARQAMPHTRKALLRWLILAALTAGYFAGRSWLSGFNFAPTFWELDNPASFAVASTRRLSYAYLHGRSAWLILYPAQLSADYSFDAIPLLTSSMDLRCLAPLSLYVAILAATTSALRRWDKALAGCVAWLVLPFLPATHIVTVATVIAERVLYMPSIGLCLGIGHLLASVSKRLPFKHVAVVFLSLAATRTLMRSRDWSTEERLFASAIAEYPRSSKAHFAYGNAIRYSGRNEEAIQSYMEATRIFPKHSDAYLNWGIGLSNLNRPEESLKMLHFALNLDPKSVDAYEQMATIFFNHNEPSKTLRALELAHRVAPLSQHALNVRGAAQLTLGDAQGAEGSFKASAGLGGHPETYNNWGILLQQRGEHTEAVDKFSASNSLRPSFAQPLFNMGVSLNAMKRLSEASVSFQQATALTPSYVRAYSNWAVSLYSLRDYDKAARALQLALKLEPHNAEAEKIAAAITGKK